MKVKEYAKSKYIVLSHNRFKLFFTLIDQNGAKEAHQVSTSKLVYTTLQSSKLTKNTAKTLGELLIKLSDYL